MALNITRGRRALGIAGIATSCALGLVLSPTASYATPAADKATVQAQIVQAQHEIEVIAEQYNDAKIELAALNAAKLAAQTAASDADASLVDEKQKVAETGAGLYKGSSMAEATTLMTASSPQEIIDRLNTLAHISEHYGESIQTLTDGQAKASTAQAEADAAAQAAAETEKGLAAKKAAIESQLPDLEAKLASLTEAERQAVLAQAGGHATGSDDGHESATSSSAPSTTTSSSPSAAPAAASAPSTSPPAASAPAASAPAASAGTGGSASAQGAVQAALSRLGSPYVWGAAGPNSFDCSGLILWAYAKVGVSLPHSSSAQGSSGTSVSLSALAPGDIVWMPGHVGMYIGNGQVVHAPTTGDVVKVVPLSVMSWQKAARIV